MADKKQHGGQGLGNTRRTPCTASSQIGKSHRFPSPASTVICAAYGRFLIWRAARLDSHSGKGLFAPGNPLCSRTIWPMHEPRSTQFFRPGGRTPAQLRPLTLTPGFVQTAEGSVLVSLGNTRVLTNATIEQGVPGWLRNSGRGWVTAEYAMLPRSTVTRTPRESERGKIGGRTHEIQRLIGRSLRSVIDMHALGERTVILDCDVIQADGGTRTAAITGAAVALALALKALVAAGTMKQSPLKQLVAATSVGIVDGTDSPRSLLRRGLTGRGGYERGDDGRWGAGGDPGDGGKRKLLPRAVERAHRSWPKRE